MRDYSGEAQPEIFTLHDMVHRLTLRTGIDTSARGVAQLVIAIQDAVRGLPGKHDWSYYRRQARLTSSAAVTGAAIYDHTGNTHERQLTLTGAEIWPADAEYGEVRVGIIPYRVQQRISDTVVTLAANFSLTEDYTGSVTWQRKSYGFSREVTKTHYARNLTSNCVLTYAPPATFSQYEETSTYGTPRIFTWRNGGRFGATDFALHPEPVAVEQYEISATVNPVVPTIHLVSGADATVTAGSATALSPTGGFNSSMVGCIFRLSRDLTPPTYFNTSNYSWQAFVVSVDSPTQLTLSEAPPSTGTFGWALSSPMDIEASVMLEYLEDECFSQYTKNHKHESVAQARAIVRESLRMAVARDNKTSLNSCLWVDDHSLLGHYFYNTASISCL